MKLWLPWSFLWLAGIAPVTASFSINEELGRLRTVSGSVVTNTPTLFVLVYDENNDSVLPGQLGSNQSLKPDIGPTAYAVFAGKKPTPGDSIGADRVLKVGVFSDPDGIATFAVSTSNFIEAGIVPTAGRKYALYWFPGISTPSIPTVTFQVGGIQETTHFTGTGLNFLGMQTPPDGSLVTTSILDTELGGDISDPARFTAINAIPEPTRYIQWRTLHFPDPADFANDSVSGPLACPSGDGMSNLVRYAHGVGPSASVGGLMPVLATTPEATFTFRFRYDPTQTDLAWRVTAGNQLTDWAQVLFDSRASPIPPLDGGWLPVPLPPNLGGGPAMDPRMFARLEVIQL